RIVSLSAWPLMILAIPPSPSADSAREIDGARLPDHDYLDLSGILELFLEPSSDLLAELRHADVVHVFRVHHHPYLAAGLDGKAPLDAREAVRDLLELLESLDVRLEHLAAGARPCAAHRIRGSDEERLG